MKTRPTVLHLVADLGGHEDAREVVDLAVQTQRAGWRALIASAGGVRVMDAERSAVRHTVIPFHKSGFWGRWRCRAQLDALIHRERPALLHVQDVTLLDHACRLSLRHKLPLLVEVRDFCKPSPRVLKRLQRAQKLQARFRVPSDAMARHATDELHVSGASLYRVFPGLDLTSFDPARVTPERLHRLSQLWRLPEQALVVLMATPWEEGYGHAPFLEALARSERQDIFAVLIGNGKHSKEARTALERLVTAKGLDGRVVMPEQGADWPAACWLASLVIATNTRPRGQAPELLAAQAMGRPVIVTACGANTELAHGGETAWVVPVDDGEALTQALTAATSLTADQRIELAQRTRQFVADYFPHNVWAESYLEIYAAMLAQPMESVVPL